jgi:hypothetical protein
VSIIIIIIIIIVIIIIITKLLLLYGPLLGFGRFFSFLILYSVGRTPWMGDLAVARQNGTNTE